MKKAIFNTKSTGFLLNNKHKESNELMKYNNTEAEIIKPLTEEETDIPEVGNMYRVKFTDGFMTDVFEDELTEM